MHAKILVTRKELYDLVWAHPLKFFTEKYMVSYSSFKKICLDNNVPIPPNGYWSKKRFGKEIEIQPFVKETDERQIILYLRPEGDTRDFGNLTELDQKIIEIELDPNIKLSPPKNLSAKLDPILQATKQYLNSDFKIPDNLDYYKRYYPGPVECWVSKSQHQRALIIIFTLKRNLKARGHDFTFGRYGSFVKLFGIEIRILLTEKNKKIKFQGRYGDEYRFDPTGDFYIQAGENYYSKIWNDAKSIRLEEKLSSIIAWLEIDAERQRLRKIERERQENERKEKERREKERQELINNEIIAFKDLYNKSELWHKAQKFRTYLKHFEDHLIDQNQLTKENIELLEFGHEKADWMDPLSQVKDEVLKDINPSDYIK